ncbi:response regulator transcription factor [Jannaschia sp. LMIT008]|uniref:response regulator transcription factor n=1 Tax=Jannaschia maritima TaxID=3032585 RepID=UPI0028110CFC|nr:response regulator transcription factor [Jannaschia sp. LMIT008]
MRLLFVEGRPFRASERFGTTLQNDGFAIDVADGAEADAAMATVDYDLIFVRDKLPCRDSVSYIKDARHRRPDKPIVLLDVPEDARERRVSALDGGADDVVGPCVHERELLARVRAILRRPPTREQDVTWFGDLAFDAVYRTASVNGRDLRLARRELGMLECLMRANGRVVVRRRLEEGLYGFGDEVSANAIDVAIHRLRAELRRACVRTRLVTIRGVGYALEA